LRDAGVTVKYVILDDGWQSTALSSKGKDQDKAKDKSRAVKDKKLLKSSTSNSNTKTQDDSVEHSSDHDSTDAHKKLDSPFVLVGKHADTEEDDGELSGAQIDGSKNVRKRDICNRSISHSGIDLHFNIKLSSLFLALSCLTSTHQHNLV
jgi:hypothetical protein